MKPFLKVTRDGAVAILTMSHPETRNAISDQAACDEFVSVLQEVGADTTIGAMILTGEGAGFSAGGNVKKMKDRSGFAPAPTAIETRLSYKNAIQRIPLALWQLEVPTIAAVNGAAVGAGLDLACMCDIRIASDNARFAESFVKLGIIPGDGGAWLLPRVVGRSRAAEMCFTGEMIDAETALNWGLVSRVVPGDALMDTALELARKITANPIHAVRMSKRLMREGEHSTLSTLLEMSAAFQALAHGTDDHTEAVDAFLEKRPPSFTGR
ncbi:crotonase/enoyl-CoA hydratase family protein [Chachezhania sediminis]|uniref:crotonase/enoyl-CoA hydratase family protein n=1 Tax=Chachezhania sediminis TaxID=2599291 RepID=UPI00131D6CAC|nr:crotonase/enoyl-CoA hydratase family protein [Chachezhania sediminis]